MNDLTGLDWNTRPSKAPANPSIQYPSSLHATPSPNISRQPSPLSAQQSGNGVGSTQKTFVAPKPSTNDSFSNLISSNSSKQTTSLTLQERQKQLLAEKAKQATREKQNGTEAYNTVDAQFWEGLGSGRGTPAPPEPKHEQNADDDDLLAAFSAAAPVDSSSHYPPPAAGVDTLGSAVSPATQRQPQSHPVSQTLPEDDDDPFGLGEISVARTQVQPTQKSSDANEDDVLGLLGKPVEETSRPVLPPAMEDGFAPGQNTKSEDKTLAELLDMGFPMEKAKQALLQTGGTDVQAAVGWLLNQAHHESRSKSRPGDPNDRETQRSGRRSEQRSGGTESTPAWMQPQNTASRNDSRSPVGTQKDATQYASELGNSFFKQANAIWRTGQKRVQKAMAEYQYEGDKSQPRWMWSAQQAQNQDETSDPRPTSNTKSIPQGIVTDEAILLESGGRSAPAPKPARPPKPSSSETGGIQPSRERSSLVQEEILPERPSSRTPSSATSRPSSRPQPYPAKPVERLSRQAVEEESSQVYVSPARRRKQAPPMPKPTEPEPELDIFAAEQPPIAPKVTPSIQAHRSNGPAQSKPRPKAPPRKAPKIASSVLTTSTNHRQQGTEAFKRGDYGEAHTHYSNALTPLPDNHPIVIVLKCNRALTNIKIGDPKAAVIDADSVISVIGASQGEGETIALGGTEGDKSMKEFYGKALMRKAEALEHLEKWEQAGKVWQQAVEAGVGGAVSIQGRNRCEKAETKNDNLGATQRNSASKPAVKPRPPRPKKSAVDELNGSAVESEAVKRLRAQNEATSAASDEQFALADTVDARLTEWKGGKSDNLRALLASLDNVLWADAGWTKVGMSDLVMPNRVKIVYMKAIGKVHPDKIPRGATTEQRMVSESVFATLNEAWDKFKRDNGL